GYYLRHFFAVLRQANKANWQVEVSSFDQLVVG
ncbi:MAG: hypothetical protein ACI9HB_003292, partial [Gammaproteobacteria bacterium]